MSLASTAARGALVTTSSKVINALVSIAVLVVLARLLPPELFGLVAIVVALNLILSTVVQFGLTMAAAQATTLTQRAQSALLLINLVLGGVAAGVFWLSADVVAAFYDRPDLATPIHYLSVVPLLEGMRNQFHVHMIRESRFGAIAVMEVVAQCVAATASVTLALSGRDMAAVIALPLGIAAVRLALFIAGARWWPGLPGLWSSEVKELLAIGWRLFAMGGLRQLSRSSVVPVLGLTVSAADVGQYDRAHTLSNSTANLLVDGLTTVVVPTLSRLRGSPERMAGYVARLQLLVVGVSGTAFLFLAAVARPLVEVMLGSSWELAGRVLQLLALGAVFRALGQTSTWLFIASGHSRTGLRFNAWAHPAVVAVTLAGLPWGVLGVAVSSSIAWFLYWPLSVTVSARAADISARHQIRSAVGTLLRIATPVGIVAFLVQSAVQQPLAAVALAAVAAATTVGLVYATGVARGDIRTMVDTFVLAIRRPDPAASAGDRGGEGNGERRSD